MPRVPVAIVAIGVALGLVVGFLIGEVLEGPVAGADFELPVFNSMKIQVDVAVIGPSARSRARGYGDGEYPA